MTQSFAQRIAAIDVAVAIADVLSDIIVYCRSEALKYGLPLEAVLDIIMDSNESKLGANGKPIYDANGTITSCPQEYWTRILQCARRTAFSGIPKRLGTSNPGKFRNSASTRSSLGA